MNQNLLDFSDKIDYQFKDQKLLEEAFIHPSSEISRKRSINYQRLEFLGDAVLSMIIAKIIIDKYQKENEGQLSKRQAFLVSGRTLANIAKNLDIGKLIILSKSEELNGGRENKRNLENCLEALIGAIYLDSGLEAAQNFVSKYWKDILDQEMKPPQDPVSYLQEIVQGRTKKLPKYQTNRSGGDEHRPIFTAIIDIDGIKYAGNGYSKKEAQKKAAKCALKLMFSDIS